MDELHNVTMLEEVESKEVKEKLDDITNNQAIINVLTILITLGVSALLYFVINIAGIFIALALGAVFIVLFNLHFMGEKKELEEIYKIAQHNDLIRHDEMIRERERERLKNAVNNKQDITKETIKSTQERLNIAPKIPKKK